MITYTYKCTSCGKIKELDFKTIPDILTEYMLCICGGIMKRKYTPTSVVFSGKGFYSTDNRRQDES